VKKEPFKRSNIKFLKDSLCLIGLSTFFSLCASVCGQANVTTKQPSAIESVVSGTNIETLVCIRHGERLSNADGGGHDLGQLTPQGLNRSLALPNVLLQKFGRPEFIFAPNPARTIGSSDKSQFCYIRPLITIAPTAIFCGLPINTEFGFTEIGPLEAELRKPAYRNATVFIAWEHASLEKFVRRIVSDLWGDGKSIPVWDGKMGYDAIYVVKILTVDGQSSVTFSIDHEGLDGQSTEFPKPSNKSQVQ
jgi:hypothetical protein